MDSVILKIRGIAIKRSSHLKRSFEMASPTDTFVDVLMTLQGTFDLNDLPDRVITYMIVYNMTEPTTSYWERQSGLRHIINSLGLTPGDEDYNVFDRVTRPEVLLDLAELGFDPYKVTSDNLMLHQTRLNLFQWAALLEMGYDLCLPGIADLEGLPRVGSTPSSLPFDPTRALLALILTIYQLPSNSMNLTTDEIDNISRLINLRIQEMSDCPDLAAYMNYVSRLRHTSPIAIRLLNVIHRALRAKIAQG